jgi:hypothetical protein
LKNIDCALLGLVGENEGKVMMDQAKHFVNTVSSKNKRLYIFTLEKDGTADHCQIDNRGRGNQIMFDWLDELFLSNGINVESKSKAYKNASRVLQRI